MSDLFDSKKIEVLISNHKDKIKQHEEEIVKYQEMIADAREKITQEKEILAECEKYIKPINDLEKQLMDAVKNIEAKYNIDNIESPDGSVEKESFSTGNQFKKNVESKEEIPVALKYFNH